MTYREISDEEAAIALAEVDPEGRELDWWGWGHMIARLADRGYQLVIVTERESAETE